MKNKFDINICKCGSIYAIPCEVVDDICYTGEDNNGDIAIICSDCGNITIIGADYIPSYECDGTMGYDRYNKSLDTEDNIVDIINYKFQKPTKVLYVKGYRVPMVNGRYANYYGKYGGGFEDITYPNFTEIERRYTTMEDVRNWLDRYRKDRQTVNMDRLIHELPEDVCEALSCYIIDGLDWTGTKFDKFK